MDKIRERNAVLLILGLKATGTMEDAWAYVEEQLYINEADELFNFCTWVDHQIGGCSHHNIKWLFKAWKQPDNEKLAKKARELTERIKEINAIAS